MRFRVLLLLSIGTVQTQHKQLTDSVDNKILSKDHNICNILPDYSIQRFIIYIETSDTSGSDQIFSLIESIHKTSFVTHRVNNHSSR